MVIKRRFKILKVLKSETGLSIKIHHCKYTSLYTVVNKEEKQEQQNSIVRRNTVS